MRELVSVDNHLLVTEIIVMLPIKYVGNGLGDWFVVMAIEELLDFCGIHEKALQSRDYREVAKESPWSSIARITGLLALFESTLIQVRMIASVCHT